MTDVPAPKAVSAPPPRPMFLQHPLFGSAAIALCLIAGLWLFVPDWLRAKTDDAYVEAHVEAISARVAGYVQALHVDDNSRVQQGQVLLELDPRDFEVRLESATAALATARSRLEEARAQSRVADRAVGVAAAEANTAQANADLAAEDLKRFVGISDVRAVSTQRLDTARATAEASAATLRAARTRVGLARDEADLARAQEHTAEAAVQEAGAALTQAKLDLSYTRVIAPQDGSVANKVVEQGGYVQPGQTLLSLVPATVYVIANFKETQIEGIRVGSAATVEVDSFPRVTLRGHVESLQRGSGARFALLPPENATGNFVKIVQRIPVKIVLDESPETLARLSPGMSAVVSVRYTR
jgi:membrane fusion protein, multidrug efflux system